MSTLTPSPYPNRLQHRELVPGLSSAVRRTEWEVLPDLAHGSATGTDVHAAASASVTQGTALSPVVITEADRATVEAVERKRAAAVQMRSDGDARTRRALGVVEASGIPLAHVDGLTTFEEKERAIQAGGRSVPDRRDVFQAACDGDVAMLERCLRPQMAAARRRAQAASAGGGGGDGHDESEGADTVGDGATAEVPCDINAKGQPNPLLYKGVQFEKRWTFAAPPIVFAAAFNRERAVAALVAWGANVHATSTTGLTAKDYAEQRGYHEIVRILEEAEQQARSTA